MGSYDSVHAGDRCGQTKALGKGLRDLVLGDRAQVFPAPLDDASTALWLRGEVPAVTGTANVAMGQAGSWLVLRDGVITAWQEHEEPGLPRYDRLGRLLPEGEPVPSAPLRDERRADLVRRLERGEPGPEDLLLDRLLGARPYASLDPRADAEELARRTAGWREAAAAQLAALDDLPADCPWCAAVRARRRAREGSP